MLMVVATFVVRIWFSMRRVEVVTLMNKMAKQEVAPSHQSHDEEHECSPKQPPCPRFVVNHRCHFDSFPKYDFRNVVQEQKLPKLDFEFCVMFHRVIGSKVSLISLATNAVQYL